MNPTDWTPEKPLKAYKVYCDDDDHGQIVVFAQRTRDISKHENSDQCDCGFIERRVCRAPAFDKYAPGPVTSQQYLAEGWYWHCSGCHGQVWGDQPAIFIDDSVFCKPACVCEYIEQWKGDTRDEWFIRLRDKCSLWLEQQPVTHS